MATRADFYVGRGEQAEWLGSIAFDGYPDGDPQHVLGKTTEAEYRAAVAAVLDGQEEGATRPSDGWPWPWETSHLTDFAYAFDEGCVWGSPFGHGWHRAGEIPESSREWPEEQDTVFPDMRAVQRVTLGPRSGLIVLP